MSNPDTSGLLILFVIAGILAILAIFEVCCTGDNPRITQGCRKKRPISQELQAVSVTQISADGPLRLRIPLKGPFCDVINEDDLVLVPEPTDIQEAPVIHSTPYHKFSAEGRPSYSPVIGASAPPAPLNSTNQPPTYSEIVSVHQTQSGDQIKQQPSYNTNF